MPKVVDHEARRRELAEALWRVVLRDGVEHASVREVAAEAGWSSGSLRHYFPNQDDLLRFAMELAFARFIDAVEGLQRHDTYLDTVRDVVHQMLPLDEQRRGAAAVWMAFMPRCRVNPELGELEREGTDIVVKEFAALFEEARQAGQFRDGADPLLEAKALVALCDGVTFQHLLGPENLTERDMIDILDRHLAALLPAPRATD